MEPITSVSAAVVQICRDHVADLPSKLENSDLLSYVQCLQERLPLDE